MKNFRQNRQKYIFKSIVLPALLCAAIVAIFIFGAYKFNELSLEQDRQLTLAAIKKASVEELCSVKGVSAKAARSIRGYFDGK